VNISTIFSLFFEKTQQIVTSKNGKKEKKTLLLLANQLEFRFYLYHFGLNNLPLDKSGTEPQDSAHITVHLKKE
jgi:hypothetical protein